MPSYDKLNPQPQIDMDPDSPPQPELINTGNNPLPHPGLHDAGRGPAPGDAPVPQPDQRHRLGQGRYGPGENGGISGIVFYDTTRAENDPRYGAGEPWQPGIPRVQVNLYRDTTPVDGIIDDLNGDGPTLADVDNYPFGWREDPNPWSRASTWTATATAPSTPATPSRSSPPTAGTTISPPARSDRS